MSRYRNEEIVLTGFGALMELAHKQMERDLEEYEANEKKINELCKRKEMMVKRSTLWYSADLHDQVISQRKTIEYLESLPDFTLKR